MNARIGYFAVPDLGPGFAYMKNCNLYKFFHRRSNKYCTVSKQAHGL